MKFKSFIKELLFYLFLGIIAGAFIFLVEKVELSSAATSIDGYKAAYIAFKAANICCVILWVMCLFLQITFNIGILLVLCVSAVWLTLIISFFVQNNKHSK